ncbi:MAG: hypothetical protein ACR2RB_22030 [Gammaproteobacteria bacterium]
MTTTLPDLQLLVVVLVLVLADQLFFGVPPVAGLADSCLANSNSAPATNYFFEK